MSEKEHETVVFSGIAPISKGTNVKILLDDPENPKEAYQISVLEREIIFTNEKYEDTISKAAAPEYRKATIEKCVVFSEKKTKLELSNIQKFAPSSLRL